MRTTNASAPVAVAQTRGVSRWSWRTRKWGGRKRKTVDVAKVRSDFGGRGAISDV